MSSITPSMGFFTPPTKRETQAEPLTICRRCLRLPLVVGPMVDFRKMCLPQTHDCGLIWRKGLCRCNESKTLKMRSSQVRVDPKSNGKYTLRRRPNRHTQTEGHGKTQSVIKQPGTPRIANIYEELGEGCRTDSPSQSPEWHNPADTLILGF